MYFVLYFCFLASTFFVPPPLIYLLGQALWKKLHMRGSYMFYVCLEIHTLLYRSRYLEEDEKKYLFEKVRKNLVVSKLNITRSSILYGVIQSPSTPSLLWGRGGIYYVFESHRIFPPFVLDSLNDHEILVKFAFVIVYI